MHVVLVDLVCDFSVAIVAVDSYSREPSVALAGIVKPIHHPLKQAKRLALSFNAVAKPTKSFRCS